MTNFIVENLWTLVPVLTAVGLVAMVVSDAMLRQRLGNLHKNLGAIEQNYRKQKEQYFKLAESAERTATDRARLIETVDKFVEEFNSWHNTKIHFFYNTDGWHLVYGEDELKLLNKDYGDCVDFEVGDDNEGINEQNEEEDENN